MSSLRDARLRLAKDLLAAESRNDDGQDSAATVRRVLVRMHRGLTPIVGSGGVAMVLRRGAIRAADRCPALRALEIPERAPPTTEGLERVASMASSADAGTVFTTYLAQTLAVLARLVGWALVLRLVEELWPGVAAEHDPADLEGSPESS